MTTALYRRYRPDSFQDVIGQDHVTSPLMAALQADRVTHAYLFSGPRGCGKTTSARILARCLNCEQGPTDTPCGQCASCKDLATGGAGSLDVVEIDAASHNGVEDARDLRERAAFAPARDRYKIFILDEAHMVTPQGFNALLKLVEEPPPHVKFIFATTEPEKVIGTIRSRTHHYPFRLVPPEVLEGYLGKLCDAEGVQVGAGVFPLVVRAGGGSVRDTLSVMDQLIGGAVDGAVDYQRAVALLGFTDTTLLDHCVDALAAADGAGVFRVVDRVVESGHDPRRFVEDLLQRLRDLLVLALAGAEAAPALGPMPQDQLSRMEVQARTLGPMALSRSADMTAHALTRMVGATSPRLQLELLMARLIIAVSGQHDAVPAVAPVAGTSSSAPQAAPARPVGGASVGGATGAAVAREALARAGVGANAGASQSGPAQPGPAQTGTTTAAGPAGQAPSAQSAASTQSAVPAQPVTSTEPAAPSESSAPAQGPLQSAAPAKAPAQSKQSAGMPAGIPTAWDDSEPAPATPAAPSAGAAVPSAPSVPSAPVAEPTSPAAPAAPASTDGTGGSADAEMIRARWQEVLDAVQRSHRATWALVGPNSQPGTFDAGAFTLLFSAPGLVGAFERSNHSEVMSEAISQALGLNVAVRAVVAGAAPATPAQSTPARSAGTPAAPARPAPTAANTAPAAEVPERPFEQPSPQEPEQIATVHRLHPLPKVPEPATESAPQAEVTAAVDPEPAPAAPTPPATSTITPGLGAVSWDSPSAGAVPWDSPEPADTVTDAGVNADTTPAQASNDSGWNAGGWTPGGDSATESRMNAAIAAARAAATSDYQPPQEDPLAEEDPFEDEIPDRNDPDAEESGAIGVDVVKRILGATILEEVTVTESGR